MPRTTVADKLSGLSVLAIGPDGGSVVSSFAGGVTIPRPDGIHVEAGAAFVTSGVGVSITALADDNGRDDDVAVRAFGNKTRRG